MGLLRSMFTLDVDSGMSDRDRITLSPIEKWRQYRRFPFKLIVHAMLLALTTIQIFVVVTQFTGYARSNELIFSKEFLEIDDLTGTLTDALYSVDDFMHRLKHIVETYYSFDDGTINRFILDTSKDTGTIEPINLIVHLRTAVTVDNSMVEKKVYPLTMDDPLGPFANVSQSVVKSMLNRIAAMEFAFELSSVVPTQFMTAPFRWSVVVHFKNTGGIFEGQVISSRVVENQSLLFKLGWIPISLIIVSAVSLTLQVKATIASAQIYFRTRSAFKSIPKEQLKLAWDALWLPGVIPVMDWKDVPVGVKLDFFGSWYGLEIMGEVFLLIACFHGLINDVGLPISDLSRVFLGTGFLIICVGFARYLEYWKKFYMLIITMQGSFQRNLRFVISVLPLYMGFTACGFVIFSPYSDDFASLDKSAITLFALLNGDDIHTQFDKIYARYPYPIVGQMFLFTFIIMFITLVLNIFLFIIEDAYHAAKDFINNKAERHSRMHRRKDSGRDGPGTSLPRLGDVEFDLPTLFDLIEESIEHIPKERKKHIRKRDKSKRDLNRMHSHGLSLINPSINGDEFGDGMGPGGSMVAFSLNEAGGFLSSSVSSSLRTPGKGPAGGAGGAMSSTYGGQAMHNWGGREGSQGGLRSSPSGGLQRTRSSGLTPQVPLQSFSSSTQGNSTAASTTAGGPTTFGQIPGSQASASTAVPGSSAIPLDYAHQQGNASSSSSSSLFGTSSGSFVPLGTRDLATTPTAVAPFQPVSASTQVAPGASKKGGFRIQSFGPSSASAALGSGGLMTSSSSAVMPPTQSSDLQSAIAHTIASSQAEFLLEVDEKMKVMRERFASKLQADLELLLSSQAPMAAAAAPSQSTRSTSPRSPSPSSSRPQGLTQEPTSPATSQVTIPSFIDDTDSE